jgi:hypothetical protein
MDQFIPWSMAKIIYLFLQAGEEGRAESYAHKLMDYIEIRSEEAFRFAA